MTAAPPAGAEATTPGGRATPAPRVRVRVRRRDGSAYDLDDLALLGLAGGDLECRFLCASGTRWGGRWRGVRLSAVVERAAVDPDATHVVARGRSGHAACVPVAEALDGLLAVERDGVPLPPTRRPRLVVPGVDAARTVKGVRELRFRRLGPGSDPTEYERLGYDDGDEDRAFPAAGNGRRRSSGEASKGGAR